MCFIIFLLYCEFEVDGFLVNFFESVFIVKGCEFDVNGFVLDFFSIVWMVKDCEYVVDWFFCEGVIFLDNLELLLGVDNVSLVFRVLLECFGIKLLWVLEIELVEGFDVLFMMILFGIIVVGECRLFRFKGI